MSNKVCKTCERCGKTFSKRYNLLEHLKRKNPCTPQENIILPSEEYKCPECDLSFTMKSSLDRHLKKSCKNKRTIHFAGL